MRRRSLRARFPPRVANATGEERARDGRHAAARSGFRGKRAPLLWPLPPLSARSNACSDVEAAPTGWTRVEKRPTTTCSDVYLVHRAFLFRRRNNETDLRLPCPCDYNGRSKLSSRHTMLCEKSRMTSLHAQHSERCTELSVESCFGLSARAERALIVGPR